MKTRIEIAPYVTSEPQVRFCEWLCRIFGHKPTGLITGFRIIDGAVITRCSRCKMPIVCRGWYASKYIREDLYAKRHNAAGELRLTDSDSKWPNDKLTHGATP